MKIRLVAALLLLLIGSPAFAIWEVASITPNSTKDDGMTVAVAKRADGTFGFTITRYLDVGEKPPADAPAIMRRTARLEIHAADNPAKLLLETTVAGETQKDTIIYRFSIARELLAGARFSVSERDEATGPGAEKFQRVGGVIYEAKLPDFIPLLPLHP